MNFFELIQKYQKFIIYSVICLAIVSFFSGVLAIGIILVAFLGAITFLFINKNKEHANALGLLFLIVFIVHILAVLFVFYTNFQPFSGGRGDYTEYNAIAQEISNRIHRGNFSLEGISLGHYYPVIVGYLYTITTPNALVGELFNAWLIALIVIVIYLIVLETGASKKEAFIVGLIASFYPSLAFFGSLLLKEALTGLLCMVALLMMLKIIKEFSWGKFFIFYIILLGVTHFRFYISYALVITFIICWLFLSNLKIKQRLLYGILMIPLIGFLPNISRGEGVGQQYFGINIIKQYLTPQTITYYREVVYAPANEVKIYQDNQNQSSNQKEADEDERPTGNESSVTIKTGLENPTTFLKNTSWSFISALLGPFPWQIKKATQLLILPEAIAWYFALFFIIKGIVKNFRQKYKIILPITVFSIIVFGVLSIFLNNYGITTRIRIPAILSLLCLLPFGLNGLKNFKIPFFNNLDKYFT